MKLVRGLPARFAAAGFVCAALQMGCAQGPLSNPDDLCQVFAERPAWRDAAGATRERWGVPESVQLAIVYQESRFRRDARPPRRRFLGFIPLSRPSSAYGFGQALDGTWREYVRDTGQERARRSHFPDVADFIGWYAERAQRRAAVSPTDPYQLYLVYHEGVTGFRERRFEEKPWLLDVARKVESRAATYGLQQRLCEA
ncbi:MAG: hypothetical protein ACR2PQ_04690 [Myxococcota bacterium]